MVRKEITLRFIPLRLRPDLVDLIVWNSKRGLSDTDYLAREGRTKHVLDLVQGWPKNEMRECKVIFSLTLNYYENGFQYAEVNFLITEAEEALACHIVYIREPLENRWFQHEDMVFLIIRF